MIRPVIRRHLWAAVALLVLGLCLFADCAPVKGSRFLAPALAEVAAVLSDPGTQWMVCVCAGIYFLGFVVLRGRLAGWRRTGTRWNASLPGEAWLLGLLGVGALAYALDYTQAVKSTQALTLLGAAMIGQGAALWQSREQKAETRNTGGGIILALIILLTVAAVWQGEAGHFFQYRGQGWWSGPWDNPNTFGMLMGVGLALSLGRLVLGKAESRKQKAEMGGEHPASNGHPRPSTLNCNTATRGMSSTASWRATNCWTKLTSHFRSAAVSAIGVMI